MNNKDVNSKLAQHSKENRIMNAMRIRAGNQQENIYQQQHDKLNKYPDKRERRNMSEMLPMIGEIDLVPVKRVDDSDSFING